MHENMYGIRGGLIYISVASLFSPKRGVFVILYNLTKALFNNAPQQDSKPISTPVMGTPVGAVNYSEHGLPQEINKTGDGMSQNDYENLRKVL